MTPYLSEPRAGIAGLFLGTLNDAKWSPLDCLDDHQRPSGAAVLRAGSNVRARLELAPKLLSVGLNFTTGLSPSVNKLFPSDGSAVSEADISFVPEPEEGFLDFRKLISMSIYRSV